jgi:hypothetical protein
MFHNLLRHVDVRRISSGVAAGTTTIYSGIVDMSGYTDITFLALFGAITGSGVAAIKVQQGAQSDGSDMADLAGTSGSMTGSAKSNMMLAAEVYRPTERYVRLVIDRTVANVVIDGVLALLSRGETLPPALHSTVGTAPEIFNSPAEGTA